MRQADGTFGIICDSIAGKRYALAFKNALDDLTWTPTGQTVTGTGQPITISIGAAANAQRFFRIIVSN